MGTPLTTLSNLLTLSHYCINHSSIFLYISLSNYPYKRISNLLTFSVPLELSLFQLIDCWAWHVSKNMLKHNLSILGSKYIYIALILNSNKDSLFIYEDPFEERVYSNKPNGDFFCGHSFVCLFVPFEVGILLKISAPQKSLSTGSWTTGGGAGRQRGRGCFDYAI